MSDFEKMAQEALAASDGRVAEAKEAKRVREAANDERLTKLEADLDANVEPVLKAAAVAFMSRGIPTVVRRTWETHRDSKPTVTLQCDGPEVPNHFGGRETPRGAKVLVSHQDDKITVKINPKRADGIDQFGGALPDALSAAIEHALSTYLVRIEQIKAHS